MLSTNALLRDGRYQIRHTISSGRSGALYTAKDQTTKQHVAVVANTVPASDAVKRGIEHLTSLLPDGIVRIAEDFQEKELWYKVTEPIDEAEIFVGAETAPAGSDISKIFTQLGAIMLAISELQKSIPSIESIEIVPETIIKNADGNFKLLVIDTPGILFARNPVDSPYLPFEIVWNELDLISQRAFYREFDDSVIASLESPPDERGYIYSLGAVFYKHLTNRPPLSAFERWLEMLDTKKDPLQSLSSLNPSVTEAQSQFVLKMLALKREDRFASIEDAIFCLPASPQKEEYQKSAQLAKAVETDEPDLLLEIPTVLISDNADRVTKDQSPFASLNDTQLTLSSIEVTPESIAHNQELDSFIQQFYKDANADAEFQTQEFVGESPDFDLAKSRFEKASTAPALSVAAGVAVKGKKISQTIGIFAAGVVAVAVGSFGMLSLTSADATQLQDQPTYEIPVTSVSSVVQELPSPSPDAVDKSATVPNTAPQVTDSKPDLRPIATKVRSQLPEVKPNNRNEENRNEARQSPKSKQTTKKKLTVDDLLN